MAIGVQKVFDPKEHANLPLPHPHVQSFISYCAQEKEREKLSPSPAFPRHFDVVLKVFYKNEDVPASLPPCVLTK